MNNIGIVFSLAAILFFGTFSSATAAVNQHANENSDRASVFIPDRYIVVLKSDVEPRDVAKGHGVSPQHVYKEALNGFVASISPTAVEKLKEDSRVKYVEQDKIVEIAEIPSPQVLPNGMDRINLETNNIFTLGDVGDSLALAQIAVIDTGVDLDHPDLRVHPTLGINCYDVLPPFNLINCDEGASYADDDNGHGTSVAGTAAALDNGIGVVGVAPGATIVPIKVLTADGMGSVSTVIAGVDYATLHVGTIDVANLSLRVPVVSSSLNDAVAGAVDAGLVMVVAAGNDVLDASTVSPASEPKAITVSALADFDGKSGGLYDQTVTWSIGEANPNVEQCTETSDDSLACFTNFGSIIDLAAPGVKILTTVPIGTNATCMFCTPEGLRSVSGTSIAAPHVAGAAALIRSQDFNMSPAEVEAALLAMAAPKDSSDGYTLDANDPQNAVEPMLMVGESSTPNPNQIPIADSGPDQTVDEIVLVTLDGSGSSDPNNDPITYSWEQTAGTIVTLTGADTVSPTFTAPEVGAGGETLTFELIVTDDSGANSSADTVDINVLDVPSTIDTVHVGDLEYNASNKKNWKGDVWITVHYQNDNLVEGATVNGNWFDESATQIGSSSCLTDGTGICQVSKTTRGTSMTFNVTGIVFAQHDYDADENHDADGDIESTGTSISITKGGSSGDSGDTGGGDPGNGTPTEAECQAIVDQYYQKDASGKKIPNKLQSDFDECIGLYEHLAS